MPLAGVEGLEPPTPGFGDRCSSQLSYTPKPLKRMIFQLSALSMKGGFATALLPNALGAPLYRGLKSRVNERRRVNLHPPRHMRVQV
jgi:hypothetical protein